MANEGGGIADQYLTKQDIKKGGKLVLNTNPTPTPNLPTRETKRKRVSPHWNADHNSKAIVPPKKERGKIHSLKPQQMAVWQTGSSMK